MSRWFGASGNCGCCDATCAGCENITELIVSGLYGAYGNCDTACSSRNGTYLFRQSPWSGSSTACGVWSTLIGSDNCGLLPAFPEDRWEIGAFPFCTTWAWGVRLELVSGLVRARVTLTALYTWRTDGRTVDLNTNYAFVWQKTASTCSELVGTIPLLSTTISTCNNSPSSDTRNAPDVCDAGNATIELA